MKFSYKLKNLLHTGHHLQIKHSYSNQRVFCPYNASGFITCFLIIKDWAYLLKAP